MNTFLLNPALTVFSCKVWKGLKDILKSIGKIQEERPPHYHTTRFQPLSIPVEHGDLISYINLLLESLER